MALPRDASAANDFRHLTTSLGSSPPFEKQGVSGTSPKPSTPQKQTAAQGVGSQRGGKTEVKAANFRDSEYVRAGLSAIAKSDCPHDGLIGGPESRDTTSASRSSSVTVISNLHRESLIGHRGPISAPDAKKYPPVTFDPRVLPSRATLARKWPALKINRFTGRWRDDASGASGADVASLLAFLGEGAR